MKKTRSIKKENRKLNDGIGSADKEEQNVIERQRLWLAQGDGFQKVWKTCEFRTGIKKCVVVVSKLSSKNFEYEEHR